MPEPDKTTQGPSTGVTLPVNLVRQTIAYLESHGDPMAVMLREHHKYWLEMSGHSRRAGKRLMKV